MKNKSKGIIFFKKKIKDSDLYIRVLSSTDEVHSGIVYGGDSSKNKLTYQNGYFIDYNILKKNQNSPIIFTAEIAKPYLGNIFNDNYKMNAMLSILSLINISIVEGQYIKGLYNNIEFLIDKIIKNDHWIILYCEWLFILLKQIGYQIDYKMNNNKKYYDLVKQEFSNELTSNSIEFPHIIFLERRNISFKNINAIFLIFESILIKNHLDNINYKMPINFINFKNLILKKLQL